jgi:DNA-binding response OmpR family regulator
MPGPTTARHFRHGETTYRSSNAASNGNGQIEPSLTGARLLIVDDDADALELMSIALEASGATVITASSAAYAREEIAARRPDVIIADVGMPHEDGCSLVRRIREQDGSPATAIPVIALSGYATASDRRRGLEAGFDAYLSKPVDFDTLIDMLASLLRPRG